MAAAAARQITSYLSPSSSQLLSKLALAETTLYRCSAMNLNTSEIPATAAGATGALNITVVRGHELAKKESRKCYVVVTVDEKKETTKDAGEWDWNETFRFDVHGSSKLAIQVYGKQPLKSVKLIGTFEGSFVELFESAPTGDFDVALVPHTPKAELRPSISLRVELDPGQMIVAMAAAVQRATFAARRMGELRASGSLSTAIDGSDVGSVANAVQVWEPLLQKLRVFDQLAGTVAEVHPYAKAAYSVIAAAYKVVQGQIQRDANILCLADMMDDTYSFIQEAEPLRRIESQKEIMTRIAQQTVECGHFIAAYCRDSFGVRMMKHLGADTDSLILQFGSKFTELKESLKSRAIIQTEILVFRVLEKLQSIATEIDFQAMPYAEGAYFQSSKACLPETQIEILDELIDWINNSKSDSPQICILSGAKSSGKSTVAHSIALHYHNACRLGSAFFFDHVKNGPDPELLFPTIARDLADLDTHYKNALWDVICNERALRTTRDINDQFLNFILKPAQKLTSMAGPIVLVIDGLDTNCSLESQHALLSVLSKRVKELPINFRILLTTHTKTRMQNYFPDAISKSLDCWTKHDLLQYVLSKLSVQGQLFAGLDKTKCYMLVDMSNNDFPWLLEVCNEIEGNIFEVGELGPSQRLQRVIEPAYRLLEPLNQPDSFYLDQLSCVFDKSNSVVMHQFTIVMGLILTAQTPLSKHSLQKLLERCIVSISQNDVSDIIQSMSSLLSGTTYYDVPIQPLYSSFYNFLRDASHSQEFWIDVSSCNSLFSSTCLQVLNTELLFNVLHLRTHMYTKDIPALADCVWECISAHLQYACRFLANHLNKSEFSMDLLHHVQKFLYKNFLFWLETLSLMDAVEVAVPTLNAIAQWVRGHNTDVTTFVEDALAFLQMFQRNMIESVSTIYLDALLLLPSTSHISKYYKHIFIYNGDIIDESQSELMHNNGLVNWAVNLKDTTNEVAYSSMDHMLCVWDLEVYDGVILEGHTDYVTSVAFSPNSKQIASASFDKSICIWNAETEQMMMHLKQHTSKIASVVFSPDGKQIVAGSSDKIIWIWNVETGKPVLQLKGHTEWIKAVAISPDGKQIVSGCFDSTICIWDAETGEMMLQLKGHTQGVTSVVFSPNGKQILSASFDKSICIWNAETGKIVLQLKVEDTVSVLSVAFSPDGKQIVADTGDNTICIWNPETGEMMLQLEGHTASVSSVAFSPDGKQIISGSDDCTICIWNAETGEMMLQLRGHTCGVTSVAFSPDGKHIVSGSSMGTVCIWNADLETVFPLQGHISLLPSSSNTIEQMQSSSDEVATIFRIELRSGDQGVRASQDDSVGLSICGELHRGANPSTQM